MIKLIEGLHISFLLQFKFTKIKITKGNRTKVSVWVSTVRETESE